MLTLEIIACVAVVFCTPFVTWHLMQCWHDWAHGKRPTVTAPSPRDVTMAVETALARSARTARVAERCDPRT